VNGVDVPSSFVLYAPKYRHIFPSASKMKAGLKYTWDYIQSGLYSPKPTKVRMKERKCKGFNLTSVEF